MYTFQKKAIGSMYFQSPHKYRKDVSLGNDIKEINNTIHLLVSNTIKRVIALSLEVEYFNQASSPYILNSFKHYLYIDL